MQPAIAQFVRSPDSASGRRTLIVGGGFYGCSLALYYRAAGDAVTIVEREAELMQRASYGNQARVHQGYHYPRSLVTGLRCVANFRRFCTEFPEAVGAKFTKLYGVARADSAVTAAHFERFCLNIGAPVSQPTLAVRKLFDRDMIEELFVVEECAFDSRRLRDVVQQRLATGGIEVRMQTEVQRVEPAAADQVRVTLGSGAQLTVDRVICCAYAGINTLLSRSGLPLLPIKRELAELALVTPPPELASLGITIMDGPFFSCMPFPAAGLHSLSHVRYTPHAAWWQGAGPPDAACDRLQQRLRSRFPEMVRDAARYIPSIRKLRYQRSLYEMKAVLKLNERNDGRPILLKRNYGFAGLTIVMGGKIDNIYDVCQALDLTHTA